MGSAGADALRNSAGRASIRSECRFVSANLLNRTNGPATIRERAIGCRTQELTAFARCEANEANKAEKSLIHLYASCEDLRFGRMESMRDDANSAGASRRVGNTGQTRTEVSGESRSTSSRVGVEAAENCEIHRAAPKVQGSSEGSSTLGDRKTKSC
jgi:hypothetical protein